MTGHYRVEWRPAARRELGKLPADGQRRIIDLVSKLTTDPRPHGCDKLTARGNAWRVRSGDYRVVYEIVDELVLVTVVGVGHRRDIYRH